MLGVEVGRAQLRRQERMEQLEAELPRLQADLRLLLVLVDDEVLAGLAVALVLPKVTGVPATFCSSIATCSSTWPSQVPSPSCRRRMKPPGSP